MDAIREQLNKPVVVGVAALILGLLLGIFYGWVIDPVEWSDAAVSHLREDLKVDYLRMAIDSYELNKDAGLANSRYSELGENADEILQAVETSPSYLETETIFNFRAAVQAAPSPTGVAPTEAPTAETKPGGRSIWSTLFLVLCVVGLLALGAAVFYMIWRNRGEGIAAMPRETRPAMQDKSTTRLASEEDLAREGEPPMVQFMASYKLGDDLFDDSFSIDSPAGEFLGECGVGISENIGVGEPKKVTAFEVWLFDKNDIQTVTKVLMSAHAFLDEATRQRLAAKGEPVLAEAGGESVLETQTLRLIARVVDMGYGEGPLPDDSFFDRLLLELAVWPKQS
jgi:hypothetical protein